MCARWHRGYAYHLSTSLSSIYLPAVFLLFRNFQLSTLNSQFSTLNSQFSTLNLLVSPFFSNFALRLPQFLADSTRKD